MYKVCKTHIYKNQGYISKTFNSLLKILVLHQVLKKKNQIKGDISGYHVNW